MTHKERAWRLGAPIAVAAVLLAFWQAAVMAYDVPAYLVPSPARIAATLWQDRALLMASLYVTAGIALTALAIAPLIIIWVKDTRTALVLCAVVVAIFPIISNASLGLRSVDGNLLDLFRMSRATRWQTLVRLRIPSALPYFFAGLRVASGLSLIGAVVAEFVAGTGGQGAGLAYQILMAGIQLNVPRLFAALVLITLAGIAMYLAVGALSRAVLARWHESELSTTA
jgi:NitT/TauT family transport system permease protein